jgi:hypothetical protein
MTANCRLFICTNRKNRPDRLISRILLSALVTLNRSMIIHLGCTLPYTSCDLPENFRADNSLIFSYLVLHRTGFTKLFQSPEKLVRSYRTVSPLPEPKILIQAVYSLLHFPSRHHDSKLWSVLSCGVRTFLQIKIWRSFCAVRPILYL